MKNLNLIGMSYILDVDIHRVNGDESGNQKTTSDQRSYIAGQKMIYMQQQAVKSLLEEHRDYYKQLSLDIEKNNPSGVSNEWIERFWDYQYSTESDGRSGDIRFDVSTNFWGFMDTSEDNKLFDNKRKGVAENAFAIAMSEQNLVHDDLVRLSREKNKKDKHTQQRILSHLYSQGDLFSCSTGIHVKRLSQETHGQYYAGKNHYEQKVKYAPESCRKALIALYLDAMLVLEGFANQSRASVNNHPREMMIVLSPVYNKSWIDFYSKPHYQESTLDTLDKMGAKIFQGSDNENELNSVYDTIQEAKNYIINECELSDPAGENGFHDPFIDYQEWLEKISAEDDTIQKVIDGEIKIDSEKNKSKKGSNYGFIRDLKITASKVSYFVDDEQRSRLKEFIDVPEATK